MQSWCHFMVFPLYKSLDLTYRIAGNFQGTKYSWFSNIETFRGNIFVVGAWTAGKGRQGRYIRG